MDLEHPARLSPGQPRGRPDGLARSHAVDRNGRGVPAFAELLAEARLHQMAAGLDLKAQTREEALRQVAHLARMGFTPRAIARALDRPLGEVDVLLRLAKALGSIR